MEFLKQAILDVLLRLGYSLSRTPELERLQSLARRYVLFRILSNSELTSALDAKKISEVIGKATSQLGQDVLALSMTGTSGSGYFVEFGATNGLDLSNTFLLEKHFGWSGIVSEPAKRWHSSLSENRSCLIDYRCVWSTTGDEIEFAETSVGELSTISKFVDSDTNGVLRKEVNMYTVDTVSLEELLLHHQAPNYIDFISIDTEGSEFEILSSFDFSRYRFGVVCVEHNFTENREKLNELLVSNGYTQIYSEVSSCDDWYVGPEVRQNLISISLE